MNPINKHKILKAETNVKNGKEKQESEWERKREVPSSLHTMRRDITISYKSLLLIFEDLTISGSMNKSHKQQSNNLLLIYLLIK
jgi:hypothetical protein